MRMLSLAAIFAVLLADAAYACRDHALRGLFCLSRGQIEAAYARASKHMSMELAVAEINANEIVCVYASKLHYVVVDPEVTGGLRHNGGWRIIYKATLVRVLVGGNPRPVQPPVPVFFVPEEELPDTAVLHGA